MINARLLHIIIIITVSQQNLKVIIVIIKQEFVLLARIYLAQNVMIAFKIVSNANNLHHFYIIKIASFPNLIKHFAILPPLFAIRAI